MESALLAGDAWPNPGLTIAALLIRSICAVYPSVLELDVASFCPCRTPLLSSSSGMPPCSAFTICSVAHANQLRFSTRERKRRGTREHNTWLILGRCRPAWRMEAAAQATTRAASVRS
jgi:hypothetical protein